VKNQLNRLLHEIEKEIIEKRSIEETSDFATRKLAEFLPVKGVGIMMFEGRKVRIVAVGGKFQYSKKELF